MTNRDQVESGQPTVEETDRRKDEFLATLAHELRNPLAPLRNALQLMQLSPDRHTQAHAREMMERQLSQLVHLVDDLLDVSRISTGKLELRKERMNIATAVRNAIETSHPLIEARRQQLTVEMPNRPVWIDADPVRLSQALLNLLNNAAKYSDPDGRIQLSVACEGDEAVIRVKDDGIGIDAQMLPRIFDLFVQADRSIGKSQGGLGIGLSLVKRLIEMHGGQVEAHSEGLGHGSEFIVRLPVSEPPAVEEHSATAGKQPASQDELSPPCRDRQTNPCRRRVLVVDDNRDAAESMGELLAFMDNEVRIAVDGARAIEEAALFRPDMVLLDIGLPGLDGYEVARRIRSIPDLCKVKLVALTGWGQEKDRRLSREAGFDHHLVKPTDPVEIAKILRGLPPEIVPSSGPELR